MLSASVMPTEAQEAIEVMPPAAATSEAPASPRAKPAKLTPAGRCVLQLLRDIEGNSAAMRGEIALGPIDRNRQKEIINYIDDKGALLARVATAGLHLPDEMKTRVLGAFRILINLRDDLDSLPQP